MPLKRDDWSELWKEKYLAPQALASSVDALRRQGKRIATLNGSFDLLHAGHLHIIHRASLQADCLIVALNSDSSIRRRKGEFRPLIPMEYRLQMMAAIEFVDYVTYFEEDTPLSLLEQIRPDVHVNGSEYGEQCIEAETVLRYGGRLCIVDLVPGLSTSAIVEKAGEMLLHSTESAPS